MNKMTRSLIALIVCCLFVGNAFASEGIPDHWQKYTPKHLKVHPGYQLYLVEGNNLRLHTPDDKWPMEVNLKTASEVVIAVAPITTTAQATEFCEMLMHGGTIEDRASYDAILKIHQDAGFKQEVKDDALAFDRVAEKSEGGFRVAFTAFYLPQGMAPNSVVTRFEFVFDKYGKVSIASTNYLTGMMLNWQTERLDTEEAQKQEAKARARVAHFVADCIELCKTKLPVIHHKEE